MAHLSKLTSREAVLNAIAEYDHIGREVFLARYEYGRNHSIFIRHEGRLYEQRPIIGVAYGKQYPTEGPLLPSSFKGGKRAGIRRLAPLGFDIVECKRVQEPRQSAGKDSEPRDQLSAERRVRSEPRRAIAAPTIRSGLGSARILSSGDAKKTSNAATATNCRCNGKVFEELAECALRSAGFNSVSNLNVKRKQNFPFADILANEEGVWYAISVKGRHRLTHDGHVKNRYKLDVKKADRAIAELRQDGLDVVPAFVAVEVEGDRHSVYFGLLKDLINDRTRKNGIGMRDSEKARYRCLVEKEPHRRSIQKNDGLY